MRQPFSSRHGARGDDMLAGLLPAILAARVEPMTALKANKTGRRADVMNSRTAARNCG